MCLLLFVSAERVSAVVCPYLGDAVFAVTLLEGVAIEICRLVGQLCDDGVFHLVWMVDKTLT